MGIKKRGGYWYVHISITGYTERIRKSTGLQATQQNKAAAQEMHDVLRAKLWRRINLGEKPSKVWQHAVVEWMKEKKNKKSINDDVIMFKWMSTYLDGMKLEDLTRDVIDKMLEAKEQESSPARANRYAALVRAVLNMAANVWVEGKFPWLERAPKVRMRQEPKHRIRWLREEEAARLLKELPDHLKAPCEFSLHTGLREGNCAALRWQHIDMTRMVMWVDAHDSKSGKAMGMPLNSAAMRVLRTQKATNKQDEYVFEYRGKRLSRFNNHGWRKALVRASIEDFKWHDLRHTWASWHVQKGTPLHVLQKLGNWASIKQVLVYAHLAPENLISDAERITDEKFHLRIVA